MHARWEWSVMKKGSMGECSRNKTVQHRLCIHSPLHYSSPNVLAYCENARAIQCDGFHKRDNGDYDDGDSAIRSLLNRPYESSTLLWSLVRNRFSVCGQPVRLSHETMFTHLEQRDTCNYLFHSCRCIRVVSETSTKAISFTLVRQ